MPRGRRSMAAKRSGQPPLLPRTGGSIGHGDRGLCCALRVVCSIHSALNHLPHLQRRRELRVRWPPTAAGCCQDPLALHGGPAAAAGALMASLSQRTFSFTRRTVSRRRTCTQVGVAVSTA